MGKKSKKTSPSKPSLDSISFLSPRLFDAAVVGCLLIVSFAWWWPHRYLPFWWDSADSVGRAAHDLLTTNFNPPLPLPAGFAHSPLVTMLVALAWKLMGVTRIAAHLTLLPFLGILLTSTYGLAKKIAAPVTAFLATLALASVPIVLHEASQIYFDLPTAALTTLSLLLLTHKKLMLGALALCLAALSKETALLMLPLFALQAWPLLPTKPLSKKLLSVGFIFSPLVAYLAYATVSYHFTGFWLSTRLGHLGDRFPSDLTTLVASVSEVASGFFIGQGMWLATLVAGVSLVIVWRKQALVIAENKLLLGFLATVFGVLTVFALFQEYTLRSSLMILPLWLISAGTLLEKALATIAAKHAPVIIVGVSVVVLVVFGLNWYPQMAVINSYSFSPPTNMTALDRIFVFRQAAKYLELTHQGKEILGGFPENQQLTQVYLGYVDTPLPFALCSAQVSSEASQNRLLVFHPYSPGHIECKKILDANRATLLQRFERNGSWVEIYELEAQKPDANVQTH